MIGHVVPRTLTLVPKEKFHINSSASISYPIMTAHEFIIEVRKSGIIHETQQIEKIYHEF